MSTDHPGSEPSAGETPGDNNSGDANKEESSADISQKLKVSRSKRAGWLTRSINLLEDADLSCSPEAIEAIKSRIVGCLKSLQATHEKYILSLEEDDHVEEAQEWMDKYFSNAMSSLKYADKLLHDWKLATGAMKQTAHVQNTEQNVPDDSASKGDQDDLGVKGCTKKEEKQDPDTVDTEPLQKPGPVSDQLPAVQDKSSNPNAPHFFPQKASSTINSSLMSAAVDACSIDSWIDDLVTGQETTFLSSPSAVDTSVTQMMARLEIERDLPKIALPTFDGSPLVWPRFVEQFYHQVHSRSLLTDVRRMDLLQSHMRGDAKLLIQGLGYSGKNYAQSLKELKFAFGHRVTVARAYLDGVTSGGVVPSGDPISLRNFYVSVRDCVATLQQMNYLSDFSSCDVLRRTSKRIPNDKRNRWNDYVKHVARSHEPTLLDLQHWLKECVESDFGPYAVADRTPRQQKPNMPNTQTDVKYTTMNTSSQSDHVDLKACPVCGEAHHVSRCAEYINKSAEDKYRLSKAKQLCFNCLYPLHRVYECKSSNVCRVQNCGRRHHTTLHEGYEHERPSQLQRVNTVFKQESLQVCFQVLPVVVLGKNGRRVSTYALLDSASDISMVSAELAKDLGLKGECKSLTVNTVGSTVTMPSKCVSLAVRAVDDPDAPTIQVNEIWTKDGVFNCAGQDVAHLAKLPQLQGLCLPHVKPEEVKLLIGASVPRVHLQQEVREGGPNEPLAIRTCLGWCLLGVSARQELSGRQARMNLILSQDDALGRQIEQFWKTESFGVAGSGGVPVRSMEDRRAEDLLRKETRLVGGHYEVPMLWRDADVKLPTSRGMAEKRFATLSKRLQANESMSQKYSAVLNDYILKGYARKLTVGEAASASAKTWYLPHHGVINPKKPEKLRVVFDAAACVSGTSLNQELVTGPDLLNSLFGVLLRFRSGPIALVADIESMFHQVRVPEDDSDSLRFLWKEDFSRDGPPDVYKMLVHIFGATDSPCCANYALTRTALDREEVLDEVVSSAIFRDFYVDDLLKSVNSVREAVDLAQSVTSVLASGGFRLTKWMSSSREVLAAIPDSERARPVLDLNFAELPVERALGVGWNVATDSFVFAQAIKDVPGTKRGVVSAVSSVFDPCGFLAPFTFRAKCLIQELWRASRGWDDHISEQLLLRWRSWQAELPSLSELSILRHRAGFDGVVKMRELHFFSDASEAGFGAVAYVRSVDSVGLINCSFLAAKTHVAPIKQVLTVPKLELQGALMAVRLYESLKGEIGFSVDNVSFWTDAQTVLRYITNDSRRLKIFVANRVTEIRESSLPSQWKYVPTHLNPADYCTRGMSAQDIKPSHVWLRGPEFLWSSKHEWPQQLPLAALSPTDDNVRRAIVLSTSTASHEDVWLQGLALGGVLRFERCSSWYRLLHRVAWFVRAVRNFASTCPRLRISAVRDGEHHIRCDELRFAELCVIRVAQREAFGEELQSLRSGHEIGSRSHLRSLMPLYDRDLDLVRVGGRLQNAPIPQEAKHQILLPYGHHVTGLLMRDVHVRLAHAGPEHMISSIRQRFWPLKSRLLARSVVRTCLKCRRRTATPCVPVMAELPSSRVAGSTRPFQFVGVDFFGPMYTKRGRATVKKWGCIFTCLTVRAIHLELADSLEADDFILVLRRFIGRRGSPQELYSDNGTNFVGAQKELQEALASQDTSSIGEFLMRSSVKWIFIPPHAPHFGGAWERLIKSVKIAMNAVLGGQLVTDSVLRTVLVEVEGVINGRPLTPNSAEPEDYLPITPNHFLHGGATHVGVPGFFEANEISSRKRWRQGQVLADHVWCRWLKEYLPSLTVRSKWTKEQRNLAVHDVVLLVDENAPRGRWLLGRVVEIIPSTDGRVRSARVRTAQGVYHRPASKICCLEESGSARD